MNKRFAKKKNIFEGLQLMFYSNTNSLAGNGTWIGSGEYTGSYRLQEDTIPEKIFDTIRSVVRPLFPYYRLFTSQMP